MNEEAIDRLVGALDHGALVPLCQQWRAKADDYLRIAKAYQCRSHAETRAGYVKQSAQLRMCADELEKALAQAGDAQAKNTDDQPDKGQDSTTHGAMVQVDSIPQALDGSILAGSERPDQGTGHLDMSGVRELAMANFSGEGARAVCAAPACSLPSVASSG